ncbi:MAG TPA: nickel pincer cofactor biosynthesis protein LarC [Thermoplasmatales archaeon]|nr:nickel pincer cofactor biosynthesis protein LarC [Thermoplasmatales archaeon]
MIGYIDIISGISGDMFLASLIDAGLSLNKLKKELTKLKIEFDIEAERKKDVIEGTNVYIFSEDREHRKLTDILNLIDESEINPDIKEKAKEIFIELGKAEARIHGVSIDEIHFHEIGAVDTIVDIVGSLIGIKEMGIEKLYSSPVLLGKGKVKCEHGILPVPAPAVLELLKDKPVVFSSIPIEITTPTGAVLLSMAEFSYPEMRVKKIGYGMGKKKLNFPNVLRIIIGEEIEKNGIYVIETNIDDMNAELFPYVIERLMSVGALDAFVLPVTMKKGRTGSLLRVLSTYDKMEEIRRVIFEETTTFGIRYHKVKREILEREILKVRTGYGEVSVKVGYYNGKIMSISPEYDECRKLAVEKGISLKKIYSEAKEKARKILENK